MSNSGLNNVEVLIQEDKEGEGFIASNNKLLEKVDDDYFCLFNDDALPVTDDWMAILLEEMNKRKKLKVWFAGPSGGCRTPPQSQGRIGDNRRPKLVKHLSGFCLMCRPDILKTIGLLDSRYRHYAGEVVWQWNARKLGARSLWIPGVYVKHEVHQPIEKWWKRDHNILEEQRSLR